MATRMRFDVETNLRRVRIGRAQEEVNQRLLAALGEVLREAAARAEALGESEGDMRFVATDRLRVVAVDGLAGCDAAVRASPLPGDRERVAIARSNCR